MLATGLGMWGLAQISPVFAVGARLHPIFAIAITLGAAAVAAMGLLAFRRAATTIDPTNPAAASALVTSGIYRVTRNPMYVGFTGMLLGWGLCLQSWWALPGPMTFAGYITALQIIPEERALRAKLGAQFGAYAAQVRCWL